jgi:hypothetical protein
MMRPTVTVICRWMLVASPLLALAAAAGAQPRLPADTAGATSDSSAARARTGAPGRRDSLVIPARAAALAPMARASARPPVLGTIVALSAAPARAAGWPMSPARAAAPGPRVLGTPIAGFGRGATPVTVPVAAPAPAVVDFAWKQLRNTRVQGARMSTEAPLRDLFAKAGVAYPTAHIYLRAFKREHELEVWGAKEDGRYVLVKTYAICSLGGSGLGPKLRRGDEQVPEGFYHVVAFNPSSDYHLSLRLDYPNAADLARAGSTDLGGDIYLHGGCKSAGCLPLTDAGIEQIYWLTVRARAAGERSIPVDIFPARLDAARWAQLTQVFAGSRDLLGFWADLKQGYDTFERSHRLPDVVIGHDGRYHVLLVGH